MAQGFEEQYQDVLQNIEVAIMQVYRAHPDLLDYHVEDALQALASEYAAEQQGRTPRPVQLRELRYTVYAAVKQMCEWRLGRAMSPGEAGGDALAPEPKTLEEMTACLRRIQKSVRRWNKHGGRQGYLDFVRQYVG
jgi:hypothetical protein